MMEYEERIKHLSESLYAMKGARDSLVEQKAEKEAKLQSLQEDVTEIEDAKTLLELFIRSTETSVKNFLEPIVTESMEVVFEQYLKFHVVFYERRNQIEVDFVIIRNPQTEERFCESLKMDVLPKDFDDIVKESKNLNFMYGGAINQVLGLILRMVLFHILKVSGPLVLDEPSSAVSPNYNSRLGYLVESLSDRLGIQIVLITHSKELASFAKKSYTVSKVAGISRVAETSVES